MFLNIQYLEIVCIKKLQNGITLLVEASLLLQNSAVSYVFKKTTVATYGTLRLYEKCINADVKDSIMCCMRMFFFSC